MNRWRNFGTLLTPSILSAALVVLAALATLTLSTVTSSAGSGQLYDFLFGPSSSTVQIQTAHDTLTSISNLILGNHVLNQVLFFVLWMLIGLAVYVILAGFNKQVSDANEFRREMTYANVKPGLVFQAYAIRLVLRSIILAAWGFYTIIFVKLYFPFSILCGHIGTAQLNSWVGWAYSLTGLVVFALSLHIHVIFLRLLLLRTRVVDET